MPDKALPRLPGVLTLDGNLVSLFEALGQEREELLNKIPIVVVQGGPPFGDTKQGLTGG